MHAVNELVPSVSVNSVTIQPIVLGDEAGAKVQKLETLAKYQDFGYA